MRSAAIEPLLTWKGVLALGGAVAVLAYLSYRAAKAGVTTVAKDVNPTDPNNVINQAVTSIGKDLTGNQGNSSFTLGGWLYDITHRQQEQAALAPSKITRNPYGTPGGG